MANTRPLSQTPDAHYDIETNKGLQTTRDIKADNTNYDVSGGRCDGENVSEESDMKVRKIAGSEIHENIELKNNNEDNQQQTRLSVENIVFDNVENKNSPYMGDIDVRSGGRKQGDVLDSGEAFEKALLELGPFGFYQRYVVVLLCIPNIFSAMYSLNYIFVADQVPFRCIVDQCEGPYGSQFANSTVQQLLTDDACRRYKPIKPDQHTCDRNHYHTSDTIACDGFMYENMETTYAEFSLACNEWQRTLVGTVRNIALPFALLLTGYISDGWGRRTAFCIFVAFAGALGIIKSLSPGYVIYLIMEFLEAMLGYGFNSAAYVMVVELARPSLRAAFACATGVSYGLGGMLLALIASKVRYWRHLLRTVHTPALLLVLYWLLLDESARWLHATGRTTQAVATVRKAAQWNKVLIDENLLKAINGEVKKEENKVNPWWSVVRSRVLMVRFLVCSWCWVSAAFVYYGLTINSVSLSGDKYANFALNMFMEVVASLLIVMSLERFGRKRSIFASFLLCGISCVIPYFTSHSGTTMGMFFVGKLSITFAFNSLYVFVTELFPTEVRSSALAAVSLVGRIGSILAPQTPLLSKYVQALLYGGCSVSAALLVLLAPETRRAPLPQHVTQAETLRAPPFSPAHSRVHSHVVTPAVTPSVTPADTWSRAHTQPPKFTTQL